MIRILILILLATPSAASEFSLQLEELPTLIRERNGAVQGAARSLESVRRQEGHLFRSYLPELEFVAGGEGFQSGFYGTVTQPYGSLETRINLFRGGRDRLVDAMTSASVGLASSQARASYREQLTEARKIYWSLVYQREVIDFLNEALDQSEQSLVSANRRIQRGLTTDTDRLDLEIHRSQLKEELESFEHEILLTELRLQPLLGLSDGTRFMTPARIPHIHDDDLLKAKVDPQANSDVEGLRAQNALLGLESRQAKRWWTPSLDLYAGYYLYTLRDRDYLGQSLRDDRVAGIRLSFMLFDGLRSEKQAQSLRLRADAYEDFALQETRVVESKVRVAQEEMIHQHELIHAAEERLQQGDRYLSQTLAEYDRGVKNSPDLLGAIQRQIGFKKRYAELRRDYQHAKSELLGLMEK